MTSKKDVARDYLVELIAGGMTLTEAEAAIEASVETAKEANDAYKLDRITRKVDFDKLTDEEKTTENNKAAAVVMALEDAEGLSEGVKEAKAECLAAWGVKEQEAANTIQAQKEAAMASGYLLPEE